MLTVSSIAKEILEDAYDNSLVKFVTAYAKSDNIKKKMLTSIIRYSEMIL